MIIGTLFGSTCYYCWAHQLLGAHEPVATDVGEAEAAEAAHREQCVGRDVGDGIPKANRLSFKWNVLEPQSEDFNAAIVLLLFFGDFSLLFVKNGT